MVNIRQKLYLVSFIVVLFVSACVLSGCAYTTGSLLPKHLKTIYVDNFNSEINIGEEVTQMSKYKLYRPGLEIDVTREIVDRFVFDGNLKLAKKEDANLILRGSVTEYLKQPLRYDGNDEVEEYRIRVVVNMKAFDTVNEEIMWEETAYSGEATYMTTGQFAISEDAARDEAIKDLARRVVERTVEGW